MDFTPLIKARKALNAFWKSSLLRGRCWGPKMDDNPFRASNITMANKTELISVSQLPDGRLRIHEFCKTIGGTSIGIQIRKKLKEEGLDIEE